MKKVTKIVELIVDEENEPLTIDAISLVTEPALQENWVHFKEENNNLTFAKVIEEEQIIIAPALIPNKQILRYNPDEDNYYYVWFSPNTVKLASQNYLKFNNQHSTTYEHEFSVSGVTTVESWIKVGDEDKSKYYNFDLPVGTWFVAMHVSNPKLWEEVKSGKTIKGLSIEGVFIDRIAEMQKQENPTDKQILEEIQDILGENEIVIN